MSADTNSRGNANKSLDQCQNLSNYTTTPPQTQHELDLSAVGCWCLGEGYNCSDTDIDPKFH